LSKRCEKEREQEKENDEHNAKLQKGPQHGYVYIEQDFFLFKKIDIYPKLKLLYT